MGTGVPCVRGMKKRGYVARAVFPMEVFGADTCSFAIFSRSIVSSKVVIFALLVTKLHLIDSSWLP
jgi:hypothetical protein